MIGDLAVLDAHDIHCFEVNLAMRWGNSKKRTFMCAVVRFIRRDSIAIGELPVDFGTKVRECGTKIGLKFPHPRLVRSRARLWCMVDEIIREKFLKNLEVALALDLFGISADNRFCSV